MKKYLCLLITLICLLLPNVALAEDIEINTAEDLKTLFSDATVSDNKITLNSDVEIDDQIDKIIITSNIEIDLNQKTINNALFSVNSGVTFTISNGYILNDDTKGVIITNDDATDATINVNNCMFSISSEEQNLFTINSGNLNINGGSYFSAYTNIIYAKYNTNITLKDVSFSGINYAKLAAYIIGTNYDNIDSIYSNVHNLIVTFGKLDISGGYFVNNNGPILLVGKNNASEYGVATIDNTYFDGKETDAGSVITDNGELTIKSGKIYTYEGNAIKVDNGILKIEKDDDESLIISSSDASALSINESSVTIDCGTDDTYECSFESSSEKDDYVINVDNYSEVSITNIFIYNENGKSIKATNNSTVTISNSNIDIYCGISGYNIDDTSEINDENIDFTYIGGFEYSTVKVTYMLDGEIYKVVNIDRDDLYDSSKLLVPTKDGYTFAGWYYNDEFKYSPAGESGYNPYTINYKQDSTTCKVTYDDVILYAKMTKNSSNTKENPVTGLFIGTGTGLFIALAIGILLYSKKKSVFLKY